MKKYRRMSNMLAASSVLAISSIIATAAFAQASGDIEQVVVSASRINIAGYTQPTPVTVVGTADLDRDALTDIGDAIRVLPSVGNSDSPNNGSTAGLAAQGNQGINDINLRNLGIARTLVLFDGQRVVTSNPAGGGVDLTTIPSALITRIDVVTGGASAAWGSDAVSGVVNLVLNKNFQGVKGNVELVDNDTNTHLQYHAALTYGTSFDGDRGQFEVSVVHQMSPDTMFQNYAKWYNPQTLIVGPAGGPKYIHQGGYGSNQYTQGGLITASAKGTSAAANALQGIQFVGPNATIQPFYGFGNNAGNGNCIYCSANQYTDTLPSEVTTPNHNTTGFAYGSFKLSDDLKASLQLNYGVGFTEGVGAPRRGGVTILSGNPFIPASIQATMTAGGIPSFTLAQNGTTGIPLNGNHVTIGQLDGSVLGPEDIRNTRTLERGVFTLEGTLGNDWGWSAYIQHSAVREQQYSQNNTVTANFNLAVNAVTVTAANVGSSNLPIGSVQCASTLINPTNGCVPLNLFGNAGVTTAAADYIAPGRLNPGIQDQIHYFMNQDVIEGSVQGVLPWGLSAGNIAVAGGAGYRHEQQTNRGDPLGVGLNAGYQAANYSNMVAGFFVYEGFGEITVPVIKNGIVQSLDFNAAGRITSYSTSGMVQTWKLGASSQINDDVRLRLTWSEDIRAPLMTELFQNPSYSTLGAVDPKTGIQITTGFYENVGNRNLQPEQANTIEGGVILSPHWVPGLQLSADWYSIVIKSAIFTPTSAQVVQQCAAGVAIYCADMLYGVAGFPQQYPGALNIVLLNPKNAASETTSGLDFQADYRMDLFSGSLNWHALANYNDERTRSAAGVTYDGAGSIGGDNPFAQRPKFNGTLAATFTQGPWSGTVQGRFLGAAVLNNAWTSGVQVDNNDIPWVGYLDLRSSYSWNDYIQLYGAIDNATDTPPPHVPNTTGGGGSNLVIYDGIGRVYRGGLRFNF